MAQNPDQTKLWFNVSLTSLAGSTFELSFEDPYQSSSERRKTEKEGG